MISSDRGYQVGNIGEARGPSCPRNLQSWNAHFAKKTHKNRGTREFHPFGSAEVRLLAKPTRNDRNRASSQSDSRLTEVTANLRLVPV